MTTFPSLLARYLGPVTLLTGVLSAQPATSAQPGTEAEKVVVLETFKVYSSTRESALQAQRQSDRIGNFVTSDALGALPDDTIGEALNRIAGINVVGSSEISIRGVEGKYNAVQLDGNGLAQASNSSGSGRGTDTRNFDVSSIPVESIRGIEVIKSLTPNLDADSIGGQINMLTNNAFDLRAQLLSYKGEYRYDELSRRPGWGANVSFGRVLNAKRSVGTLLNLSLRDEETLSDRIELRQANLPPTNPDGTVKNPVLDTIDPRDAPTKSFNATLSGSIDWKVSATTSFHLKPFFNYRNSDQQELRTRVRGLGSSLNRVVIDENHARMDEFQIERLNRVRPDQDYTTFRLTAGGETQFSQSKLTYSVSSSHSENTVDETRTTFANPTAERRRWRVTYDNTDKLMPTMQIVLLANPDETFGESDLARQGMRLTQLRFTGFTSEEDEWVGKLDYEVNLPFAAEAKLNFGGKVRRKERSNRINIADYAPNATAFGRNISEFDFPAWRPSDSLGGLYRNLGSFVDVSPVTDLFDADPAKFNRSYGGEFNAQVAKLYDARETVAAGYGMGTIRFSKLTLVGGVRYERTQLNYTWLGSLIDPPRTNLPRLDDRPAAKSYDNLFPSAVATYRFNPNHVLRAAYSATIARPDYEDLVPFDLTQVQSRWGKLVSDTDIDLGNPDLKAQTADNFDLAYEFYYGDGNNITVGLFRKNLHDFQVESVRTVTFTRPEDPANPDSPLVTETLRSHREINGSTQKINGAELSWTQSLVGILPHPLDGLGFVANCTFISGEETLPVFDEITGATTGHITSDRLTNQPKVIYNLQLYWEKGNLSTRVAYNHVDEVKRNVFDVAFPVFQGYRDVVDGSLQYRLGRNLRLFLDVKNITNEPRTLIYNTVQTFPESYALAKRQWVLGVRGSF